MAVGVPNIPRKAIAWILFVILCALPVARSHAAARIIDARSDRDFAGDKYFVVFVARGGSFSGHAYVAWSMQRPSQAVPTIEAFGFHPADETLGGELKSIMTGVPAQLRPEFPGLVLQLLDVDFKRPGARLSASDIVLIVRVDRLAYEASQRAKDAYTARSFRLISNDCVTFVQTVARQIGLPLPDRTFVNFWPERYLASLSRDAAVIANRR